MTEPDRASLDRILPDTPGPADWDDVLSRAGRGGHNRRRPLMLVAALICVGGLLVAPGLSLGGRILHLVKEEQHASEVVAPAWSPDGQRIAFQSNRGGAYEIYIMNADGSGVEKLPDSESGSFAWSPNGRQILFSGVRIDPDCCPRSTGLYVVNVDGTGKRLVTRSEDLNGGAWSPDGRRIAFSQQESTTYLVNADGSGKRLLLRNASGLAWSPDGLRVAFYEDGDLHVMSPDTGEGWAVTPDVTIEGPIAWAPDGTEIAFVGSRDGNQDIYVVRADGSDERRLTNDPASAGEPAWSPDGRTIAFVSGSGASQHDIYVMNADGSGQVNLTKSPAQEFLGTWSPDGRKIVFTSDRSGTYEIYVMNADGSGVQRLTR